MTVVVSALAFLLLLSFLVLIHECGHYFAARWTGVTVEEFGFGLPPRAKTLFRKSGTTFTLNWIPFGGFVRLHGENAVSEHERRTSGSFAHASIGARVLILVAGVLMNFVFAIIIFTAGFAFWHWVPNYFTVDEIKEAAARGEVVLQQGVRITNVQPGGTAAKARVPFPGTLLSVNDAPVFFPTDVVDAQKEAKSVVYAIRTDAQPDTVVTVTVPVADGKTGVEIEAPALESPRRTLPQAFLLSLRETKVTTVQTVLGVGKLFESLAWSGSIPEGIIGPVGIVRLTHDSVQEGWLSYLRLMAVLSLSLAIFNILPFPALDGGRLVFVLVEAIRQRPAPRRFELITNTVGFLVLIGMILLVTFNDILRLF